MKKLIATLPRAPHFDAFCVRLATNEPLHVIVIAHREAFCANVSIGGISQEIDASGDGRDQEQHTYIRVQSVERHEYPRQHLIRGTLTLDGSWPGDAGDFPVDYDVTIEYVGDGERACVYLTDGYRLVTRIVPHGESGFRPEINGQDRAPRDFDVDYIYVPENELCLLTAGMAKQLDISQDDIEVVKEKVAA